MARLNFVQAVNKAPKPVQPVVDKVELPNPLEILIPEYKENKTQEDKIKKVVAEYNKKIKEELDTQGITEYSAGGWVAKVTTTEKSEFNELQAIEILRDQLNPELFNEVVKTTEYIDNDALERMIYQKTVDATLLAPCTIPKAPTITLRISKSK